MRKFTFLALVLVLVTSCSSKESYSNSANLEESIALTKEVKGTNGALIPITSSNVIAAGYDAQNQIMKVQFMSGAIYEYYGVQLELWESFVNAQPNPWSAVGYPRLVGDGYPYKRIK
jgi:uncharacterized protein YcfL